MSGPEILREPRDLTGRLVRARQARGISQEGFALYEGFTQTQMSGWELGKTEPGLRTAIRLAHALGYDLALVPRQERA